MPKTATPSPDRLISLAEAAKLLGVSRRHLTRMVHAGQLPAWRPSERIIRVSERVIRRIVEQASKTAVPA